MKLQELKQLNESTNESALKSFDATKMDMKDLMAAMENGGYLEQDYGYAQCVYGGYDRKLSHHMYHMLWENQENPDDEEKPFAINSVFVYLGQSGQIEAEPGGNPTHENMTKDEGVRKLASLKKTPSK